MTRSPTHSLTHSLSPCLTFSLLLYLLATRPNSDCWLTPTTLLLLTAREASVVASQVQTDRQTDRQTRTCRLEPLAPAPGVAPPAPAPRPLPLQSPVPAPAPVRGLAVAKQNPRKQVSKRSTIAPVSQKRKKTMTMK
jgi:hypothetical protein